MYILCDTQILLVKKKRWKGVEHRNFPYFQLFCWTTENIFFGGDFFIETFCSLKFEVLFLLIIGWLIWDTPNQNLLKYCRARANFRFKKYFWSKSFKSCACALTERLASLSLQNYFTHKMSILFATCSCVSLNKITVEWHITKRTLNEVFTWIKIRLGTERVKAGVRSDVFSSVMMGTKGLITLRRGGGLIGRG